MVTSLIKLVTKGLLFHHKFSKSKMAANPALWFLPQNCYFCFIHDDVIKWKHFPRYWPFVRGIHRSPVNSPHKGQWRGALMFSLMCARINSWVNNREAGDLRRYRHHYDVIVMQLFRNSQYCPNKPIQTVSNSCLVFGLWLIMLTMKYYGYKMPSRVIFASVGCERSWNVSDGVGWGWGWGISITRLRDIYLNRDSHNKKSQ